MEIRGVEGLSEQLEGNLMEDNPLLLPGVLTSNLHCLAWIFGGLCDLPASTSPPQNQMKTRVTTARYDAALESFSHGTNMEPI